MIVKKARDPLLHGAIGREVRAFRTRYGMKVGDLAVATNLSIGMLSKIENGDISPSLSTLQAISRGLAIPITWLVRPFEVERTAVFSKAGIDRVQASGSAGQHHKSLGHAAASNGLLVEPCMISLTRENDVFPTVGHQGLVFLYLLEGEMAYRHGTDVYRMTPGDSLFYDAATQHGAEELARLPVRCLTLMTRRQSRRCE
ncbi:XRE family transcriptional regulator [Mesorhizobium sp. CC13]|uniref:helix-turn-helix domain-containing protein n=1 Tax=Mesorhizobium sp. CC13 TaxID=3029194 RepID=UPI003264C8F5